jgi:hypothetical protein
MRIRDEGIVLVVEECGSRMALEYDGAACAGALESVIVARLHNLEVLGVKPLRHRVRVAVGVRHRRHDNVFRLRGIIR